MSELAVNRKIEYIQQRNEFDYLKALINSLGKGRCIGILLHGPPGTGKTLLATSLAKDFNSSYFIIDGSPDLDRRDIEDKNIMEKLKIGEIDISILTEKII